MNFLGGLIIFRMLGACVDSSGTLILALWVHLSPLDFSVVKCILVLNSGTSGRVIPLFKCHCIADELSPVFGLVPWYYGSWCVCQPERHDSVLELPVLGAKRGVVLVTFLDSDEVIGIPEVLVSISKISGSGYRFFTGALLSAQ